MRAAALLILLTACSLHLAGPRLEVLAPGEEHPTGRVELHGIALDAGDLRLRVAGAPEHAPNVLGLVHAEGDTLVFVPRFPLQPGVEYRLSADGAEPVALEFSLPAPDLEPRVEITRVLPSADVLPANLLRFYLHFSAPMRRGEAYRRVRLLDAEGQEVEGAFLPVDPELWDPERRRLTLLIDPGRIKRGLVPHEELGPVLYPGREYLLEVDAAWRDGRGAPLRAGLRRPFRTVAADLSCPDPDRWRITAPAAGTREALVVRFDEPLDQALALRLLAVQGPRWSSIEGRTRLAADDTTWSFEPAQPWASALHHLVVPEVIEDRAGNSVGRPFEVDAPAAGTPQTGDGPVRLPFEPR